MQPSFLIENTFDTNLICGIDEVGRGTLAGPVVACCILLDKSKIFTGINDSKKLSKNRRKIFFEKLTQSHKFGIGVVNEKIIDDINILEATKLAMFYAYQDFCAKYKIFPEIILVDGNFQPFNKIDNINEIKSIVKGDQTSLSIASASIVAKEYRDNIMINYHNLYPSYGFDKNCGYGTKLHLDSIKKFGICPIHRKSFEPIKSMLKNFTNDRN